MEADRKSINLSEVIKGRTTLEILLLVLLTTITGGGGFSLGTLTNRISPEQAEKQVNEAVAAALTKERADQAFKEVAKTVDNQGQAIVSNTRAIQQTKAAVDTVAKSIDDMRRQMASGFGSIEKQIENNHPAQRRP